MLRKFRGIRDSSPKSIFAKEKNRRLRIRMWRRLTVERPHFVRGRSPTSVPWLIRPLHYSNTACGSVGVLVPVAVMYAKNAGDWPMKSPMAVRNCSAPMAAPSVFVGRMIETMGRLRSRNGHGSGMIRALSKSSFSTSKSGNVTETPVTGSTAVRGGALPATSDQVWKCMVSVGPMLIRIRSTSTLVALCASDG